MHFGLSYFLMPNMPSFLCQVNLHMWKKKTKNKKKNLIAGLSSFSFCV